MSPTRPRAATRTGGGSRFLDHGSVAAGRQDAPVGHRQPARIREERLDSGRAVKGGALTLVILLLLLLPRVTALGLLVATALLALVAVAVEFLAGPRRATGDPTEGTAP
jgi:hypothetical protein